MSLAILKAKEMACEMDVESTSALILANPDLYKHSAIDITTRTATRHRKLGCCGGGGRSTPSGQPNLTPAP